MDYVSSGLRREIFGWYSPSLGMDMPIVRYGHWGHGLLLFPTASGDFLEAERMYLIKALEPLLYAGKVQLWSIQSINPHAWTNEALPVPVKAHNQAQYSRYVEDEVVPHIRHCMQDANVRIGATGASFGAFYAANAFFRRPDLFDTLVGMSGFYDLADAGRLHGHFDDNVYFNNPMSYVPNLSDGPLLDLIKHHSQIHLLTSHGQWEHPEFTFRFSNALWQRGIWHNLDVWGPDMPHDWPTWRKMLPHYVGQRLGW